MSDTDALAFMTIAAAGRALRDRSFSCRDLTEAVLARIERHNPELNGLGLVTAERARTQADALDRLLSVGVDLGPLHGVPVAIKDNIDTAGIPTTMGSRLMAERVPDRDATVVRRLWQAGAVCVGKANMYEWAYGGVSTLWGPARNPWDPRFEPGSSSNGSAVAVAAGFALGALGTDTGGSIRKPAGLCGVLGLMPSHGRISRTGVYPVSPTLDRVGTIARDAAGAYLMLQAIAGPDETDATTQAGLPKLRPLDADRTHRIGAVLPQRDAPCSKSVVDMIAQVEHTYSEAGFEVVPVELPSMDLARKVMWVLTGVDAADHHSDRLATNAEDYSATVRTLLEASRFVPATDYARCQRIRGDMLRDILDVFDRVDAVILPNTPTGAWRFDEGTVDLGGAQVDPRAAAITLHPLFNLTGLPAASVLAGLDDRGLPMAFQVAASWGREDVVLSVAQAYEQATDTVRLRPEATARSD